MSPEGAVRSVATMNGDQARERLLAGVPLAPRRLDLAGVSTSVLSGGDGPPVVLLHGPGEFAAKWMWVIPDLLTTHRVVVPDLPGHGTSSVTDGPLDADRVLRWLGELIDRTCESPPVLVGHGLDIAARFAVDQGDQLGHLVLVDVVGLEPFRPAPAFEAALTGFAAEPTESTYDALWRQCAFDLDRLRARMGETWELFRAYNLHCAGTPSLQAALHVLMEDTVIPPASLARIAVPTTLIWGRHDLATPLRIAEEASASYGWSLHVIEDAADDPVVEQPEAFLAALRGALRASLPTGSTVP
jgi:pimeloyl-ACP methyl ester carboxylesterase